MAEVIQIALDEGATTINVPDTVGYTMPDEYAAMFEELYRLVPDLRDVVVSVHCHDDLGLAVANSLAGVEAGCRQVECAINGIGERAGNASLEEIVMLLRTREPSARPVDRRRDDRDRPHQPPRLAPDRLPGAAQQGDRRAQRVRARGRHPPGRRAEGAHHLRDHGRDHRRAEQQLDRARQALRAATPCSKALEEMGFELDGQALNTAFKRFKEIADRKKQVTAMDLEALVTDELRDEIAGYALDWFEVDASSRAPRTRACRSRAGRRPRRGVLTGDGPIDAVFRAINAATGVEAAPARVPRRRRHRGPGRARRGLRRGRGRGRNRRRPGRLHRHHRGGRARLRARPLGRRRALARASDAVGLPETA